MFLTGLDASGNRIVPVEVRDRTPEIVDRLTEPPAAGVYFDTIRMSFLTHS
jgi:hypothetical protein